MRARQAAGGGRVVEVEAARLPGWLTRFADRHRGIAAAERGVATITVIGGDGATADLAIPFPPLARATEVEPIAALLTHIAQMGDVAMILVRERAFSIGVCRAGSVLTSSTDTRYVQSRTAAGGWSQQRYARRRGNQRRDSFRAAADAAVRVLSAHHGTFAGLVVGGDTTAMHAVLDDPRLAHLTDLPRRTFTDIAEPRRAVLDDVARRCLAVEITVRDADATSGT
ncbi:MAG: hypothetical protein J0I11_14110 [Actinobacteria bacterium]|nr:hypothetical protein [Actinomycetota bacterium]